MNQLETKLKKFIQAGLALVLMVPILVSGKYLFPYIHLKNISFRVIISLLFVLAIWYLLKKGEIVGKKNYVLYAFIGLFVIEIVAGIFGVNPANSFWSNYERMDGIITMFYLLMYLWLLLQFFQTKADWLWLFRVSIFTAILLSIYGLLQRAGVDNKWVLGNPAPRIASTIGNPAYFGGYLLFHIFFSVILLYEDKVRWRQALYGALAIFFTYMMYVTGTRGPFLGLVVGIIVMGILYWPRANKKLRISIASGMLLIVLAGVFLYSQREATWLGSSTLKRIANINLQDLTTIDRIYSWQTAWSSYIERPLLGWGPENYRYGFNKYYNPNIHEQWFDRAHNVILDYLNIGGPLALLFYLSALGAAGYYLWRQREEDYLLSVLVLGLLAAYFFQNLFVFDSLNTYLPLLITIGFASFLGLQDKDQSWRLPQSVQSLFPVVLGVAGVFVIISLYAVIIRPAKANLTAIEAFRYTAADPAKSLTFFQQAIDMHTYGSREIMLQMNNFTSGALRDQQQTSDFKKKLFDTNRSYVLDHLARDPHDIQFRLLFANTYLNYSMIDGSYVQKAIDLVQPYVSDSPKRLEIYFTLAQSYLAKNDIENSYKNVKKAFDITKEQPSVYINMLNYYTVVKDQENFIKLAQEYVNKYPLDINGWQQLGQLFFNAGLYQQAEDILNEKVIPSDPNNLQNYAGILSIYRAQGKYTQAIELLNQLRIQFPEAQSDIDNFIRQLQSESASSTATSTSN
jgi:O-antigen ligase